MPSRKELEQQISDSARETFSRSGGPGGQNVNKVNTQVTLHVPISALDLSKEEAERLRERLGSRINVEGEVVINSSETRSQSQNREVALRRATDLVYAALKPPRRRKRTAPTRAAREQRLAEKKQRGAVKDQRKPPETD